LYYSYVAKSLVQILLEMGRDIIKLKLVYKRQLRFQFDSNNSLAGYSMKETDASREKTKILHQSRLQSDFNSLHFFLFVW